MSSNDKSNLMPLPPWVKLQRRIFGTKPVSPLYPVRSSTGDANPASNSPLKIQWDDPDLKIAVLVRERDDGRLIAEVSSPDASLLNKGVISVGIMGTVEDGMLHKMIPLSVPEKNGCSGFADFGPIASAVAELGSQFRVIVFLNLWD